MRYMFWYECSYMYSMISINIVDKNIGFFQTSQNSVMFISETWKKGKRGNPLMGV